MELTPRSFCLLLLAAFGMERVLRLTPTDSAAGLTGRFVYLGGTLLWGCGMELLFRRFVDRPKHSDAGECQDGRATSDVAHSPGSPSESTDEVL